MTGTPRPPRWVVLGLAAYLLAVAVVLFSPVSYGDVMDAIDGWIRFGLGISFFGSGWIEFVANILIFVPLGLLLTLLLRHHWYGVMLALALSVLAEVVQIVIPSRQPSLRDILANVLGAAVGAMIAWLIVLRRRRTSNAAQAVDY